MCIFWCGYTSCHIPRFAHYIRKCRHTEWPNVWGPQDLVLLDICSPKNGATKSFLKNITSRRLRLLISRCKISYAVLTSENGDFLYLQTGSFKRQNLSSKSQSHLHTNTGSTKRDNGRRSLEDGLSSSKMLLSRKTGKSFSRRSKLRSSLYNHISRVHLRTQEASRF